jgi:hypothetical protein
VRLGERALAHLCSWHWPGGGASKGVCAATAKGVGTAAATAKGVSAVAAAAAAAATKRVSADAASKGGTPPSLPQLLLLLWGREWGEGGGRWEGSGQAAHAKGVTGRGGRWRAKPLPGCLWDCLWLRLRRWLRRQRIQVPQAVQHALAQLVLIHWGWRRRRSGRGTKVNRAPVCAVKV